MKRKQLLPQSLRRSKGDLVLNIFVCCMSVSVCLPCSMLARLKGKMKTQMEKKSYTNTDATKLL